MRGAGHYSGVLRTRFGSGSAQPVQGWRDSVYPWREAGYGIRAVRWEARARAGPERDNGPGRNARVIPDASRWPSWPILQPRFEAGGCTYKLKLV